jgi:hypothetical protein
MNLLGIGEIIGGVGKIADDLITTDKERLTLALEEKKIEAGLIQSQMEIDKVEAQHSSVFVAGWRPFIGWVGGFGMAYQFLLYPLLTWVWPIVLPSAPIPPVLDGDVLFAMVSGMLGLAGMRSFDKMKGTDPKLVGR